MISSPTAFIGGGNMTRALIAGLLRGGHDANAIVVVEPQAPQREALKAEWGVHCIAQANAQLCAAQTVVWAVKPQNFKEAAAAAQPYIQAALQLSVMAGLRTDTLAHMLKTERVVRAMPNTPALIGQGIAGLFARPAVRPDERAHIEAVLSSTGETLWLTREEDLDAVTALSGSGPAYVFLVIESLVQAAQKMGLDEKQGLKLALATFRGATALAISSPDSPAELRQRVTSKGGTTHAAITLLEERQVREAFIQAVQAAQHRAREMGNELANRP